MNETLLFWSYIKCTILQKDFIFHTNTEVRYKQTTKQWVGTQGSTLMFFDTCHVGQVTLHFCLSGKKSLVQELSELALVGTPPSYWFCRTFHLPSEWNSPGNSNVHLAIKFCFLFSSYSFCDTECPFAVFFSGLMKPNISQPITAHNLGDY